MAVLHSGNPGLVRTACPCRTRVNQAATLTATWSAIDQIVKQLWSKSNSYFLDWRHVTLKVNHHGVSSKSLCIFRFVMRCEWSRNWSPWHPRGVGNFIVKSRSLRVILQRIKGTAFLSPMWLWHVTTQWRHIDCLRY